MFDFASPRHGEPVRATAAERPESELDLTAILRRLWRGVGFIMLGGLFMVATVIALLGVLTPSYTAAIQILIDPTDLKAVDNDVKVSMPQADSGVSMAESQAKVIQSDSVLRRVVETMHLDQDEEFTKTASADSLPGLIKNALGMLPPPASRDPVNIALDTLRTKMVVRRPERTFVIDVQVQSQDPQKAADIANAIGAAYFAEEATARTQAAKRISDALNAKLATLRQAVETSEQNVARYRRDNKLATSNGRPFSDQQLGDLNQQLVAATIRTAEAKARRDQARQMNVADAGTSLPEMLQSTEMQALRQQYATLSRNTAELATRLGARHPAMAEQYAQQRDLQRLIQHEKERIIDTAQKDYDRAASSEAAIRRSLDQVKTDLATNDHATAGLRELERVLEARRNVYDAYLRRSREAAEQEGLNNTNVRIISGATPPRVRTWPPSPKIALPIGLVLGMLMGAGIALGLGAGRGHRRAATRSAVVPEARSLRAIDA